MSASTETWKLQGRQAGGWEAFLPHREAGTGSAFLRERWESVLSSFGASRSMIHQKVLWERSGVSGFLNYQLAIPGLGICQPSLSSPGASSFPLCCCSDHTGGDLLKAVSVVLF